MIFWCQSHDAGQIYALYVYVEDHRFNTDGTLSRTVFVKVSLAGYGWFSSQKTLRFWHVLANTCWRVCMLFNFQLLVVDWVSIETVFNRIHPRWLAGFLNHGSEFLIYIILEAGSRNTGGFINLFCWHAQRGKYSEFCCTFRRVWWRTVKPKMFICKKTWQTSNGRKRDAIFVKFSQNRQSWAWFEQNPLQFCQFVRDLFVSEV